MSNSKEKILYLFTNRFPYLKGEPFLETEIEYLAVAFKEIVIFPMETKDAVLTGKLPDNVRIEHFSLSSDFRVRDLIYRNWLLIFKWWISEFIKSQHRFKYISHWKWNMNRFLGLLDAASRFKTRQKNNSGNIIYYSYWFNEWASVLALARDMGMKGKLAARMHGYDFDEGQQGRGYHPFRVNELRRFDEIYQISQYGLNYVNEQYGNQPQLRLARLGVSISELNPIPTGDVYNIVSCSWLVKLKRVELIAETLSHLKVPFHWTHFGTGPEEEFVKKKAAEFLKPGQYTMAGWIPNNEVIEYYKTTPVDLIINLSRYEGLPFSLMEASSFGIPMIACDICGIPEIVNEMTGKLLPADPSPKETAECIGILLSDKSRNIKYRKGIQNFCIENFNGETNFEKFSSALLQIGTHSNY